MLNSIIKNKNGKIAIAQIVVLVIAVFAFAWMVGGSAKLVSATDEDNCAGFCVDITQGLCAETMTGTLLSVSGGWEY